MTCLSPIPSSTPLRSGAVSCRAIAELLGCYGLADARLEHLNTSENATFRVTRAGSRAILRIYRIGHRAEAEIEAELDWMQELRDQDVVETPLALRRLDGGRVGEIVTSIGPTYGVLFEELPGVSPSEDHLERWFERLGGLCARLHRHSADRSSCVRSRRPSFDWNNLIGPAAIWGPSSAAPYLDARAIPVLDRASANIQQRLQEYGRVAGRYGLIHGDLRLQNLLVHDDSVRVIDFDDCGSCWLLYDLATALSLLEEQPAAPNLLEAWIEGYARRRVLCGEDLRIIPDLIMMRRLQVLGWFGSRSDSELAREYASAYVPATVAAADDYLRGHPRLAPRAKDQS
jgi:Ser/Thr protein kinase RdoA (MazF antagonist)